MATEASSVVLVVVDELAFEQADIAHRLVGGRHAQDVGGLGLAAEDGLAPALEHGRHGLHVGRGKGIHQRRRIGQRDAREHCGCQSHCRCR